MERRLLKEKMEFHPPPIPTSVKGGLPNMMAFFTTPVFFWRPVGVMQAKIRCPSTNCPAPPGEYLEKKGFGSYARQVCGMKYNYTLLTEKLKCSHCEKMRRAVRHIVTQTMKMRTVIMFSSTFGWYTVPRF